MLIFVMWGIIVYRGVKPAFVKGEPWNLPNWIIYSVIGIPLLFLSGFVATPETNFVIADFWRWMVIHMWVEAFFEVFITVIVSYLMVLMGLVSRNAAIRVVYFATILFLGTGLLGISHNFYWNAKPVATMALGSVFSTLQFVPLILLTVEAWRFKNMPRMAVNGIGQNQLGNFWFPRGFPVPRRHQFLELLRGRRHGHHCQPAHNELLRARLLPYHQPCPRCADGGLRKYFISCHAVRFPPILKGNRWSEKLVKFAFWSINAGLMLMVMLDLPPAGAIQFKAIVDNGLWFARSHAFTGGGIFEQLTWLRGIGASVFFFGGVIPLTWFIVSRWGSLKKPSDQVEELVKYTGQTNPPQTEPEEALYA